jgi:predicted SAM-dependent methyltransferase
VTVGVGTEVRRLNWGCGGEGEPGWINSDRKDGPNVDLCCDIRSGLPLDSDSIDYAVSIHALPEVPLADLVPVLEELRRVLRPGGVLRLALPDVLRGLDAYVRRRSAGSWSRSSSGTAGRARCSHPTSSKSCCGGPGSQTCAT